MKARLRPGDIFTFWLPLAATWLMMSVEGPFLSAIIARLPAPKFNLAAYGVAFSFALIVESPVIMMMTASTALVVDRNSYQKLKRFTLGLNFLLTLALLLLLVPGIFNFIMGDLIGLPDPVSRLTHMAMVILLPWPGAIGYRRFYQGILIRANRTRKVAYGTVIRLVSMAATALTFFSLHRFPGVVTGAAALSAGVVMEALATRFFVRDYLFRLLRITSPAGGGQKPLEFRSIVEFYYPLALTSVLALASLPIVTFFMGKSRMPLESLAVLPVVNALVFMFRSLGLSYQEVAIALMGKDWNGYRPLRKFALFLGLGLVGCLLTISLTPLVTIWYRNISGLSPALSHFAILPTIIMALMPGLTLLLAFQRAVLVNARKTRPVTLATFLEISGIVAVLFLTIGYFHLVGAVAAAAAFIVGRLFSNGFLAFPMRRILREKLQSNPPKKS